MVTSFKDIEYPTFSPTSVRNTVDTSARKPARANQPSQHTLNLITTSDPKPTQLPRQMTLRIPARATQTYGQYSKAPPALKRLLVEERGYYACPRPSHDVESAVLPTYDNHFVDDEAEEPYRLAREIWVTFQRRLN